jgi:hypothetical protein
MATGGTSALLHSVTVSHGSGADMRTIASDMGGASGMGNGFDLETDDMGMDWLSGHPSLKTGHYIFTLNASDDAAQPSSVSVSWKLRVVGDDYVPPTGASLVAEPSSVLTGADITADNLAMDEFGDYISSTFMPDPFSRSTQEGVPADNAGGAVQALNLATTDTKTITGRMNTADDVDVFWVGGLTPNSVLDVKVAGRTESGIGGFNGVDVQLYIHMAGEEVLPADRVAVTGAASEMMNFDTAYSNLACAHYYLEVAVTPDRAGAMTPGNYILTWEFSTSTE